MEFVGIFFVVFFVVFAIIVGVIIYQISKSVGEWAHNNSLPVLSEDARVIAKRSETSGSVHTNTGGNVSTTYYVTFELDSGDRKELSVGGQEYGMLAEGDAGTLTHQGTRYHGFQRKRR